MWFPRLGEGWGFQAVQGEFQKAADPLRLLTCTKAERGSRNFMAGVTLKSQSCEISFKATL